jgi:hypothetical protein
MKLNVLAALSSLNFWSHSFCYDGFNSPKLPTAHFPQRIKLFLADLTVCSIVLGYLFRIGHVDKRRFDVHLGVNDFPEESVGSSVEVVHGDHVVAGVQQVNNGAARGET